MTCLPIGCRPARPGYGWLSEETPDSSERLARERLWIVDPIDGTRDFARGRIGLVHRRGAGRAWPAHRRCGLSPGP